MNDLDSMGPLGKTHVKAQRVSTKDVLHQFVYGKHMTFEV